MNALTPPKAKRAPAKSALRNTRLPGAYSFAPILQARWFERFLRLLQAPFGFVFWELERAIANIDIERERRRT